MNRGKRREETENKADRGIRKIKNSNLQMQKQYNNNNKKGNFKKGRTNRNIFHFLSKAKGILKQIISSGLTYKKAHTSALRCFPHVKRSQNSSF